MDVCGICNHPQTRPNESGFQIDTHQQVTVTHFGSHSWSETRWLCLVCAENEPRFGVPVPMTLEMLHRREYARHPFIAEVRA